MLKNITWSKQGKTAHKRTLLCIFLLLPNSEFFPAESNSPNMPSSSEEYKNNQSGVQYFPSVNCDWRKVFPMMLERSLELRKVPDWMVQ